MSHLEIRIDPVPDLEEIIEEELRFEMTNTPNSVWNSPFNFREIFAQFSLSEDPRDVNIDLTESFRRRVLERNLLIGLFDYTRGVDIDNVDDLRIKMCIKVNSTDFVTIHHELGHNYYQRAYNKQPYFYLNGANDGFHEAIGDAIALSITPNYLVQIGLLDPAKVPGADKDDGLLLRQAMDKVAFLPFGLLIDKWRWGVFNGSITPANYNKGWTDLRLQYQGIIPPVERSADRFDAGAKYHIPGNTPYTRYFLARILQFQFYKAACDISGWKGPLHRCSFYGNKQVGTRLNAMLEMGASKPWPDALQAFTGTREMSGKPMLEYFAPLMKWLKTQNKGVKKGW
jgi:peptidyl-dipeptidase A